MMSKLRTHWKSLLVISLLFSVTFLVYSLTGEGHPSYYDYYVRLADAFLHGRLYLLSNPSWLNELIPNPSGPGFYVVYPPLPAFIMVPLVALFGTQLNQTLISLIFGSSTTVLAYIVAKDVQREKINNSRNSKKSNYIWFAALFSFGTIFWWLASNGSVWLIAQVISVFFLFLAIHESFNKSRPLLIGLFVGASFWCRLPTIIGIFFFVGLIFSRQTNTGWTTKIRQSLNPIGKLAVGAGIFVICDMLYNFVRFGTPFDVGYWMIPGILNEPWFSHGIFSLQYIPENLKPFLTGLPQFSLKPPFLIAPLTGLAIWFTTPAFIFALRSKIKSAITLSAWVAIFAISMVIFTKGLSGWGFGYRYAVDFYPFLYVLTIRGIGENIRWYHKILIITGIVINFLGVLAFNKFS